MKISKLVTVMCLSFVVSHAFAADDEPAKKTTTTTTENPNGTTTTQTTEDYDRHEGPGAAGLFFEPGIRYDKVSGSLAFPAPFGSSNVDAEGVGLDMRLGFHILDIMFIAAEGNYSQMHVSQGGNNRYSADGSAYSYGPTLGLQTPWAGIRVWGTYLANGQFDPSSHGGVDLRFKDLRGYKVGLGLRVAKVGASVEYQDATYNKVDIQDAGPLSGTANLDLKQRGWLAELSFPMSL
jgi:hypothetical protein